MCRADVDPAAAPALAEILDAIARRLAVRYGVDRGDVLIGPVDLGAPEGAVCCDSHNIHCEAPADLCCWRCSEAAHDSFPVRHADGSRCVMDGGDHVG